MTPRGCALTVIISLALWAILLALTVAGWRLAHPVRAAEAPASAVALLQPEDRDWLTPADVEREIGRAMRIEVTAYACYDAECRTATGTRGRPGVAAADWRAFPPGTMLEIDGIGRVVVEDRCPACEGREPPVVDVWVPTREEALRWGRRTVTAEVVDR